MQGQGTGTFDFFHYHIGVGLADALDGGQLLPQELAIGGHVGEADLDQVVESASHHMAFHHFIHAFNGFAEPFERTGGGTIQRDLDEGDKRGIELRRVKHRMITEDEIFPLQPPDTFEAWCRAQAHAPRQTLTGRPVPATMPPDDPIRNALVTNYSILDLAFVPEGATPADALHRSRELAQQAEKWGYTRFWLAEHHNMVGIASAATAVAIGYVAGGTSTIRVGAGGIMLPNHSPLVIAEQFGTLESLYPGRIDLGLGRAPGTDQRTLRALRRDPMTAENFPRDVVELQTLLGPLQEGQAVQAVPGTDTNVPLWILGSSLFGAQLAAMLGLPYAFASHFAPDALMEAIALYRSEFKPSEQLDRPYVMAGINVVAADTDDEARWLFTSAQQSFTNLVRGTRGKLPLPIDDIEGYWSPMEKVQASRMLRYAFVGTAATVREKLADFLNETGVDEVMVAAAIHDQSARLRSYEILAGIMDGIMA